jgi:arylsulfatase A-like enzyme
VAALAAAAAALAAHWRCARPETPETVAFAAQGGRRLIEEAPAGAFDPSLLFARPGEANTVFTLEGDEQGRWSVHDGEVHAAEDGLEVTLTGDDPQVRREVDIDAASVCMVAVETGGKRMRRMELFWARAGEGTSAERRLSTLRTGGARGAHLFLVGGHLGWSGRIRLLRLDPGRHQGRVVKMKRVTLHGCLPVRREDVVEKARRPWRVDAGPDRREALLLPAGVAPEWTVEVPAAAALHLGVAYVPLRPSGPPARTPRLEVSAVTSDGRSTGLLETFEAPTGGWRAVRVALDALAGRRVRLRFRARGGDPDYGVVALGDPRLIERAAPRPRAPDVVLVSLDTVRADRLSLYGYAVPTTPRLAAWAAAHAVTFRYAVAAAGGTLPAHAVMMSGLDVGRVGVLDDRLAPVPGEVELLAERFRRAGYRTVAVTGGGLVHPSLGFDRGFNRYGWVLEDRADMLDGQVADALGVLDEEGDQPLFLFFHTYEAHSPYHFRGRVPAAHACQVPGHTLTLSPHDRGGRQAPIWRREGDLPTPPAVPDAAGCVPPLYDDGIAHLDEGLGPLLERLSRPDRDRVVLMVGDHGEGLGESGRMGHGWPHPGVARVPFLVSAPGLDRGSWSERLACGSDVAPTLLALARLPVPEGLDGRALFAPGARDKACVYFGGRPRPGLTRYEPGGRALVMELGERRGWRKRKSREGPRYAYAFDAARDPDALRPRPVPPSDPGYRALLPLLPDLLGGRRKRAAADVGPSAAPELAEQLRALGYIQ